MDKKYETDLRIMHFKYSKISQVAVITRFFFLQFYKINPWPL